MDVTVRLSGDLGRAVGMPRLVLSLHDGATVADAVATLAGQYPQLAQPLAAAVPVLGGVHATPATPLTPGRELALLTPVAGGAARPQARRPR